MVTTDIGLLSISLPVIITDLHADLALAGWIALIYALVTASLYLPCGRLSDMIGRAKVYRVGFFLYAVTSLIAGFAQDAWQLILFRGLQAIGSALVMTNSFAMVAAIFPPEERGRAMGIAGGTVSALGYTLGPVIGAILLQILPQAITFLNLPPVLLGPLQGLLFTGLVLVFMFLRPGGLVQAGETWRPRASRHGGG